MFLFFASQKNRSPKCSLNNKFTFYRLNVCFTWYTENLEINPEAIIALVLFEQASFCAGLWPHCFAKKTEAPFVTFFPGDFRDLWLFCGVARAGSF